MAPSANFCHSREFSTHSGKHKTKLFHITVLYKYSGKLLLLCLADLFGLMSFFGGVGVVEGESVIVNDSQLFSFSKPAMF